MFLFLLNLFQYFYISILHLLRDAFYVAPCIRNDYQIDCLINVSFREGGCFIMKFFSLFTLLLFFHKPPSSITSFWKQDTCHFCLSLGLFYFQNKKNIADPFQNNLFIAETIFKIVKINLLQATANFMKGFNSRHSRFKVQSGLIKKKRK